MGSAEGAVRFYAGLVMIACALATGVVAADRTPTPSRSDPSAADRWTLGQAPAPVDIQARVAWARKESEALRAQVARSPRNPRPGMLLAALAVVVAADLERAVSAGDLVSATALREIFETKLGDASVRLDRIAGQSAGGADFSLGVLALHGILGMRDHDEACRRFESAWAAGFRLPAYRLSGCVEATDPARSRALLRLAADAGNPAASEALGRSCLESVPRDLACASARLAIAAGAGRPSAKSLLGWMYAQGVGVPADPARAIDLYKAAAAAGDLSAKNNLGELHETGRGVPLDAVSAAEYYRQAAEAGFAPGQFNYGRMCATGIGVTRDHEKARTWLRAALKGGVQSSQIILDWLDSQPAATIPR